MPQLIIRPCERKDWDAIRDLRNHPKVCKYMKNPEYIHERDHYKFMEENQAFYRVALYAKKVVGYIRVKEDDVSVAVHPDYQRKSIGYKLVKYARALYPQARAMIKIDNLASQRLFEKAGYVRTWYIYE